MNFNCTQGGIETGAPDYVFRELVHYFAMQDTFLPVLSLDTGLHTLNVNDETEFQPAF